ncbi:Uncharacterised protein [Mycobacteroides abscessus subsp. abscessus]|nr:Uncharacterised protein [Mycobacteroides abscessus subsp. abscessus]SKU20933.1 Uncharacterised protein [Mycobacteroides abscessus subsp. abscessus]
MPAPRSSRPFRTPVPASTKNVSCVSDDARSRYTPSLRDALASCMPGYCDRASAIARVKPTGLSVGVLWNISGCNARTSSGW